MTIALYMDEHVPRAITDGLRLWGVDVITAWEDERGGADDSALLDRASAQANPSRLSGIGGFSCSPVPLIKPSLLIGQFYWPYIGRIFKLIEI